MLQALVRSALLGRDVIAAAAVGCNEGAVAKQERRAVWLKDVAKDQPTVGGQSGAVGLVETFKVLFVSGQLCVGGRR